MYKRCVVRFDNAIKTAIKEKGGLDNIKQGDVILTLGSWGWRYWDSEHQALSALKNKYYIPSHKKSSVNSIECFFRYHVKVCSINSENFEGSVPSISFRSLFAFIRCKASSLISCVARYTPSETYALPSTKRQKSPRHN